jgi:hypothetical protein
MRYTFLFPGQGSQKVGMGRDFFDSSDVARRRFDECNQVLGRDLAHIIFNGPEDLLTQTQNTQPALFTVESVICDALKEKGKSLRVPPGIRLANTARCMPRAWFPSKTGYPLLPSADSSWPMRGKKHPAPWPPSSACQNSRSWTR